MELIHVWNTCWVMVIFKTPLDEHLGSFYFLKNFIVQVKLFAFPPPPLPAKPSHPHHSPLIPAPLDFVHVSFIVVPENPSLFSPHYPLLSPLWLLSVCSLFQCLWLYF